MIAIRGADPALVTTLTSHSQRLLEALAGLDATEPRVSISRPVTRGHERVMRVTVPALLPRGSRSCTSPPHVAPPHAEGCPAVGDPRLPMEPPGGAAAPHPAPPAEAHTWVVHTCMGHTYLHCIPPLVAIEP